MNGVRRSWRLLTAGAVGASLVVTVALVAPAAGSEDPSLAEREGWTAAERRAHGAELWEEPDAEKPLSTKPGTTRPRASAERGEVSPGPRVQWPSSGASTLTVPDEAGQAAEAEVGDLPVEVSPVGEEPSPAQVRVELLDREVAQAAGVDGLLLTVEAFGTQAQAGSGDETPGEAGEGEAGSDVGTTPDVAPETTPGPGPSAASGGETAAPEVPLTPGPGGSPSATPEAPVPGDSPVAPAPGGAQTPAGDPASTPEGGAAPASLAAFVVPGEPDAPAQAPVEVALDYSAFADVYGGDWSDRLQVVHLPDCVLTDPEKPECREVTPVESVNDPVTATVTATIAPRAMSVMALAAAPAGSTGDWSATSLSPSAAWQVSPKTGDFSWSYPMRVPPSPGGLEPDLALGYSSGSLDGRVASTNNQSSWVGDGWDLWSGYVERKYVPCADDMAGGNNAARKTGDLCWKSDNATLVFNGSASELVKDAATGTWKSKNDDGTRIERLTGGWNDDNDKEYWKVTTTDGTQYFFGREKRSATDTLALNSAWTVPVFGNHPGDPCYNADFGSSSCTQAWRWNLDYVVDTSGNSLTYTYAKETNNYGRNLNTAVSSYVRGGYLTSIQYGTRAGAETGNAPLRVNFTVAERCLPSGTITCADAQFTAANAKSWPDLPFDLVCTSATTCPTQTSPSFFTRKRLQVVTTQVLSGTTYRNVDSWTLGHEFPDPGDATSKVLWLASIEHAGLAATTTVTLPKVTFIGQQMANRVDTVGDLGPAMNRYRIVAINSESGGTIAVNYTPQDCSTASLPASPETNTRRCFPVTWTPRGSSGPVQEYFHKYLVDSVVADGRGAESAPTETHYVYDSHPAWKYVDSELIPEKDRTWSDFRGYERVEVRTGSPNGPGTQLRTLYRYFRGLDGDRAGPGGGVKAAAVDGITDHDWLDGTVREEITYNGNAEVSATVSAPWSSPATATGANGKTARLTGIAAQDTRVALASGGHRVTRTVTTYDNVFGLPTQVDDQGDIATAADDRCSRTEYVTNVAAHLVAPSRTEMVSVACGAAVARPADVISDERTLYDGGAFGAAPTRGLVTSSQVAKSHAGSTPDYLTAGTTTYDALGRVTAVTDALGRKTTTAYTPTTGPVTKVTTTSPDPDGTGALTAHVTTTDMDPARGNPTKATDPNGKVTTATYDALGRLTAVWLPGRVQGTNTANTTYGYTVRASGPNAVVTKTLMHDGINYSTSVALYDGLLRPVQVQTLSADRNTPGRVVSDTVYDSRGLVTRTNHPWFTTGAPATTTVSVTTAVPARTLTQFDGAGRVTAEIFQVAEQERWRTTTVYGGDRVTVTPPKGGTPQTSITNARGQVTELRQYTGGLASGAFGATTYTWDSAGRLASTKDPAGNTWTNTYDLLGRKIGVSDPDKGTSATTYDDAGQVTSTTDARGVTLAATYDQLGRKLETRQGSVTGTVRAKWVYDTLAKGQVTSATRYDGANAYVTAVTGYDDGYRPLGQSVTLPAGEGALAGTYTTTYTYTADGRVKSYKTPSAGGMGVEIVNSWYDSANTLEWVGGGFPWGTYVAGSLRSVYGDLLMADLGGNYTNQVNYSYEHGTRRLDRTWLVREGASGYDLDLTYTYDDAGNVTSIADKPQGKAADTQCFAYDGLRRLTQAWTPKSNDCAPAPDAGTLGGPAPYWTSYAFDPVGNRTSVVQHTTAGDATSRYAYPAAGSPQAHAVSKVTTTGAATGVNTYAYDAAGNMTTRTVAGQPSQTLAWDAEGELDTVTEAGKVTDDYTYTADGDRLIRRQDGAVTAYLPGGVELTLKAGAVTATRYYTFEGKTIAVRTGLGTSGATALVADHHGTADLALEQKANTVTRRWNDPYGNPRGTVPSLWTGDHAFLDKPLDTTGLTQIGARYYDQTIGKFITVDPIMDLTDPQQWAPYSYSNNNPTTWTDPTGLIMIREDGPGGTKKTPPAGKSSKPPLAGWQYASKPPVTNSKGPVANDPRTISPAKASQIVTSYSKNPSNRGNYYSANDPLGYGTPIDCRTGRPVSQSQPNDLWWLVKELTGIADAERCFEGDIGSCAWLAIGIIPAGKFLRLPAAAPRIIRAANTAGKTDFIASAEGVVVPTSRSRLVAGFEEARLPSSPTSSAGTQYALPDGSLVRVMEPSGQAGLRASFTNANGGPINPFTGKPVQPPPGLSKPERLDYIRSRTHIELEP